MEADKKKLKEMAETLGNFSNQVQDLLNILTPNLPDDKEGEKIKKEGDALAKELQESIKNINKV